MSNNHPAELIPPRTIREVERVIVLRNTFGVICYAAVPGSEDYTCVTGQRAQLVYGRARR